MISGLEIICDALFSSRGSASLVCGHELTNLRV